MSNKGISRRTFIGRALGAAGLAAAGSWLGWRFLRPAPAPAITGSIVGARADIGHLLRKSVNAPITQEISTDFLIVGGGVAGLAAGWHLLRQGQKNFLLLELDQQPGGNAASGQNEVSAYPWGAHYLPVPEIDNRDLLALCEEFGLIEGYNRDGLPIYNSLYLCHAPHERLLLHGSWQDGLVPHLGLSDSERAEMDDFFAEMERMKTWIGADGKPAFAIPLAKSSRDPEILALDKLSMAAYMDQKGWKSPALRWFVNYSCRDDYGAPFTETSAWAGLHYFAARRGKAANASGSAVLTWPQGNGWLTQQMAQRLKNQLRCNALVTELRNTETGVEALYFDPQTEQRIRVRAQAAIYAGPHFTVPYVIPEAPRKVDPGFAYAPWAVANVTVRKRPTGPGSHLSWDNVAYDRDSLGYIVADHQSLDRKRPDATVLTWYQPLDSQPPVEARKHALETSWEEWRDRVVADLEYMHPGISADIAQVDVWVWGHGMISPRVGFLWGEARPAAAHPIGNIHFAHSDLSGISIFEEAFSQGLRAADELIKTRVNA